MGGFWVLICSLVDIAPGDMSVCFFGENYFEAVEVGFVLTWRVFLFDPRFG